MSLSSFFNTDNGVAKSQNASLVVDTSLQVEAEGQVAAALNQIERLHEIGQGLDAIAVGIEETIEDGGLTREAAAMTGIAAQNAMMGTGIGVSMPNMQSFSGGQSDRQQATRICMQSVKKRLKDVYNAIIKAIRSAIAKVREWFRAFMNNIPKLIKALKALGEKADKTTGSIDEKDFDISSSVAEKLRLEGKVETNGFSDGIDVLTETAKTEYSTSSDLSKIGDKLGEALDAVAEVDADVDNLAKATAGVFVAITSLADGRKPVLDSAMAQAVLDQDLVPKSEEDSVDVVATKRLFGDKTFYTIIPKDSTPSGDLDKDGKALKQLGRATVRTANAAKNQNTIEGNANVKTIGASTVSDLCDKLVTLLEIFEKNDKDFNAVDKAKEKIMSRAESAVKNLENIEADDDDTADKKEQIKKGKKYSKATVDMVMSATPNLDAGMRLVMGHSVAVTKAMMGVMETSLKNHKA